MEDKLEILRSYMDANVSPMLLDFVESDFFSNAVIINKDSELIGHYEGEEYHAPIWYEELIEKKSKILIIDNIDKIPNEDQIKFVEILKYRKVSTFELPENVVIILIAKEINKNTINKEIYSLVAHI